MIVAGGPTRATGAPHEAAWRRGLERQRRDLQVTTVECRAEDYDASGDAHHWGRSAIMAVAQARQAAVDHAIAVGADYLWMVDDDVLCGPGVLDALIDASGGEAVAVGVYWTDWGDGRPAPQVWDLHPYTRRERLDHQLRAGGVVRVSGGGACTLIPRAALHAELYWPPLRGVEHWWEDRWACLRWAVRGTPLMAVGGLPIHHAYRPEHRTADAIAEAEAGLAAEIKSDPMTSRDGTL